MTILDFINNLKKTDYYISIIYTEGSCYKFAKFLRGIFGGDILIRSDKGHAALKVDGCVYDINGVQDEADFQKPTKHEIKEMETWTFGGNRLLSLGECSNCEEPLLVIKAFK